jgi:hypothetical protein
MENCDRAIAVEHLEKYLSHSFGLYWTSQEFGLWPHEPSVFSPATWLRERGLVCDVSLSLMHRKQRLRA